MSKNWFFIGYWLFVLVLIVGWVFQFTAKGATPDPFLTPVKKCASDCPCKLCKDGCKCDGTNNCSKECTCGKQTLHGWYRHPERKGWQYQYDKGKVVRAYNELTGWYYDTFFDPTKIVVSGGGC